MFSDSPQQPKVVSVTRLNRLARQILESEIGQVWVSGEISNFVAASSGHWYFTLKDNKAQVRTAMFKGANRYVKNQPKQGDKVVVRANLSIYEARGDYQLIAEHLEPEGLGQLKQAYDLLKQKLSALGLFAIEHKKQIPNNVTKIGLVTSSTGAAVHDMLTVLQRRNPSIEVILYPSLVQGEQAAASIAQQIRKANVRNEVDVLVVGRGGGSLEDLWAFNEEEVANAIFDSDLPIVSAVGHEVDVTIADYVADLRAPTPSAAAELLSQDKTNTIERIQGLRARLEYALDNNVKTQQQRLVIIENKLQSNHPSTKINQAIQSIDRLSISLNQSMQRTINDAQRFNSQLQQRLNLVSPQKLIQTKQDAISQQTVRLHRAHTAVMKTKTNKLNSVAQLLHSVSPLATLSRGYSITFADSNVVKSSSQVEVGKHIKTTLFDGDIISEVISKQNRS